MKRHNTERERVENVLKKAKIYYVTQEAEAVPKSLSLQPPRNFGSILCDVLSSVSVFVKDR